MPELDLSKPHGVIHGTNARARYRQDGVYYDGQKRPVNYDPKTDTFETLKPIEPTPPSAPFDLRAELEAQGITDLEALHWTKAKELVEKCGGSFDNKSQAVIFLSECLERLPETGAANA